MSDLPVATASVRVPIRSDTTWGAIQGSARALGVPSTAKVKAIVDTNPTPTQLDPRAPTVLEFTWELSPAYLED
jgi:hypothetical protein